MSPDTAFESYEVFRQSDRGQRKSIGTPSTISFNNFLLATPADKPQEIPGAYHDATDPDELETESTDDDGAVQQSKETTNPTIQWLKNMVDNNTMPASMEAMLTTTEWTSEIAIKQIMLAIGLTITDSFTHVYENKEEQWAKQTLDGLNKIMNAHFCLLERGPKPGTQMHDGPIQIEDLKPRATEEEK
jgi:hypothetical protein